MVLVPLLFFVVLTVYWWHKHGGLDVCVYMSALFAVTSLLSVIILATGATQGTEGGDSGGMLWGGWEPELNLIPTLSYCLGIGICILPFSFIYSKQIDRMTNNAPWSLWALEGVLILTALINLYCVADSTLEILSGDLKLVRQAAGAGDLTPAQLKAESLPFPLGYFTYFNFCTSLAMPLMFYHMCFNHRPWFWNLALLFTSVTPIIYGLQKVDRTEPIFFALMFFFCIILFRHKFTKKMKLLIGGLSLSLVMMGFIYVSAVSMARFEERKNGGALTSVMQYGGQNYLNYCYFCEHATFANICTEREFPIINHYLYKIDSNLDRRIDRSGHEGFFISVFPSFIGDVLLDLGPEGLMIWIFVVVLISFLVIKYKQRQEYDISEILAIFVLSAIPIFGIFYYRYHAYQLAFNFIIVALFMTVSRFRVVLTDDDDSKDEQAPPKNEDIHDNSNIQCTEA